MEENTMRKENILRVAIIMVCVLIGLVAIAVSLKDKKETLNSDAMKFKEEYESYNNQENSSKTAKYLAVTIPEKNPMKYASLEEVMNVLDHGTAILYFGRPTCPWCRNAVPILIEAAIQEKISTIYYFDMDQIKNDWAVVDGEVVKTKEEKEGYYELLKAMDEYLDNYTVQDAEGNIYDVGEKRVYVPMVVCVKEGKIMDAHVGTVDLKEGQTAYDPLTSSQHDELFQLYVDYMKEVNTDNYCDEACE